MKIIWLRKNYIKVTRKISKPKCIRFVDRRATLPYYTCSIENYGCPIVIIICFCYFLSDSP